MKVTIADYGSGNVASVYRGFAHCGAEVVLTNDLGLIESAERLVVPGVGAFGEAMLRIRDLGFRDAICQFARKERPFLGICVGMQLMMDLSEEFGRHEGLGIVPGEVRAIPSSGSSGKPHKIPHIGWTTLHAPGGKSWQGTLLEKMSPDDSVYFVHSFTAWPKNEADRLADADYDGCRIAAVIARGSVYGCQFHPEKSGPAGLKILGSFLAL